MKSVLLLLFCFLAGQAPAAVSVDQGLGWKLGRDSGQGAYLVLTDIHFDPFSDPALVRALADASPDRWDAIFARGARTSCSAWGQDTNWALWRSTLGALALPGVRYDYVLVLGDFLAHKFDKKFQDDLGGDSGAYAAFAAKTMLYIQDTLARALPGVPIYNVMGNNDSDCGDYAMKAGGPLLARLAQGWPTVAADKRAARDFPEGGFYETGLPGRAGRLIALSDVFWSRDFKDTCASAGIDEGNRELDWLKDHLEADARAGRAVTIAMHIPPGVNAHGAACGLPAEAFFKPEYQAPFLKLLLEHAGQLRLVFASHTHNDDFKVLEGAQGALVAMHLAPSISPIHGNNPAFQVGLYQRKDGALLDLATYTLRDLNTAARVGLPADWDLEYGFKRAYGRDFDAAGVAAAVREIRAGGRVRTAFEGYFTGQTRSKAALGPAQGLPCSCAQTCFSPADFAACVCARAR